MAARTVSAELRDAMKQLRLGQLLATLPERITLAEKESLPIEDFLLGLFTDEIERRHGAAAARRAEDAGLDPDCYDAPLLMPESRSRRRLVDGIGGSGGGRSLTDEDWAVSPGIA